MSGGKSKSEQKETNTQVTNTTTTTTSGSAVGTVGDVFQGQTLTVNQYLPDNVLALGNRLIDLASQSAEIAAGAGAKAIESIKQVTEAAKTPDLSIVQGSQKQVYYLLAAGVAVVFAVFVFRSK